MLVNDKPYRTIWLADDGHTVEIIDQTLLPHRFVTVRLRDLADGITAIKTVQARGALLIGATAANGVCLAVAANQSDQALDVAYDMQHVRFGQKRTSLN
jgi:methylthioribose-1-phosphate isomerase